MDHLVELKRTLDLALYFLGLEAKRLEGEVLRRQERGVDAAPVQDRLEERRYQMDELLRWKAEL